MPKMSPIIGIKSYRPLVKNTVSESGGKRYLRLELSSPTLASLLKWIHRQESDTHFLNPFLPLSGNSDHNNLRSLELRLPADHDEYRPLSEHIKDHPNPTDRDSDPGKTPLYLDDIISIVGQVARGLQAAEKVRVLLNISSEGISAYHNRTPGSNFREWEVIIDDFSRASIEGDPRTKVTDHGRFNMSPEESRSQESTKYSERYRLGLLLFKLLTRQNLLEVPLQKEDLLEKRLVSEPEFARKEIRAILDSLLDPSAEKRISPEEAAERLGWLEKMYISHIDTAFLTENGRFDTGEKYADRSKVVCLGAGGMSQVFALDVSTPGTGLRELQGAIKVNQLSAPHLKELFSTEISKVQELGGLANIIIVAKAKIEGNLDGFEILDEGQFMAMERIHDTLANRPERLRPLFSPERLYDIMRVFATVAETMQSVHENRGLIHGDFKLQNIGCKDSSWDPRGIRIMDWGLVIDTHDPQQVEKEKRNKAAGLIKGTPVYMAPETLKREGAITTQSDVWSLALNLYEMLCGKFQGEIKYESLLEICQMILENKIGQLVDRTLQKGEIFWHVDELINEDTLMQEERIALNETGEKVKDSLRGLLMGALNYEPENRIDMGQFAEQAKHIADILNREFKIEEDRQVTRRRRFA